MNSGWSIALYRALIQAYPKEFREPYDEPVHQAFRDMYRDALQRGYLGVALLWFHVVPDFLFSAGEVFLAKAGDFLKWRFRLQWVIGCSAGFALARTIFLVLYSNFGVGIFKAAEGDGLFWNTVRAAAAPAIFMASIGLVQSRVLAGRCFRKAQWVLYGLAGAGLATIVFQPVFRQGGRTGNTAGVIIRILQTLIDDVSQPGATPGWALLHAVLHSLLRNIPLLIWGAAVGTLQSTAIRNEAITRYRWIKACMAGYFLSGVVGGFAIPIEGTTGQLYYSLLQLILISFAAGAVMGLFTSGPLERILFNVQTDSRKQS
jgi:hypothetical protein